MYTNTNTLSSLLKSIYINFDCATSLLIERILEARCWTSLDNWVNGRPRPVWFNCAHCGYVAANSLCCEIVEGEGQRRLVVDFPRRPSHDCSVNAQWRGGATNSRLLLLKPPIWIILI